MFKHILLTFIFSLLSLPLAAQQYTLPAGCETQQNPVAVTAADFNGDGDVDYAFALPGTQTVTLLLAVGDGSYKTISLAIPISSLDTITDLVPADVDANGRIDLLVGTTAGTVVLLQRNGGLEYVSTVAGPARAISVADYNTDARLDLIVVSQTGAVSIAIGNGDGTFTSPFAVDSQAMASAVVLRAGKE